MRLGLILPEEHLGIFTHGWIDQMYLPFHIPSDCRNSELLKELFLFVGALVG